VPRARIDLWAAQEPPLLICESRATMGVLRDLTYQYLVPPTATNGQSGGFIVTDIVPLLLNKRRVLYIGDYELRGPADQIEQNTKRYVEEHTGRTFADDEWIKIALTDKQVKARPTLRRLEISKLDNRYKPAKPYKAIECEALGQGVLVRLIRQHLDSLLPQPIEVIHEREEKQRTAMLAPLRKLAKQGA
jgi:hypothetical protein